MSLENKAQFAIAMIWETEAVKASREPFEWFLRIVINGFFDGGSDQEMFSVVGQSEKLSLKKRR